MKKIALFVFLFPTIAFAGGKNIKTIDMGRLTVCEAEKILLADQCNKQINGMKSVESQAIAKLQGLKNKDVDAILSSFLPPKDKKK